MRYVVEVRKDVKCIKCGNIGAIQKVGIIRDNATIDYILGYAGTLAWQCMNGKCSNGGLIDIKKFECIEKGFETIKND